MNLTLEQQITKAAVESIYSNAKLGVVGHAIVAFLIGLVFYKHIPLSLSITGIFIHVLILFRRIILIVKFNKEKENFTSFDDIEKYLSLYRRCMFFSGLSFGLFVFVVQYLSIEYHFFIIAVLIGLSSGAIYTTGEIFSVYIAYLFSMMGTALIWVIFQDGEAYNITIIMFIVSSYYSASTSYRYAKNFREMVIKENRADIYIKEQKESKDKITQQKDVLDYRAHHDNLTGLPNRVLFNDRLNQGMQKAKRNFENLAVCFIDIDNFKVINDSLGHEIGDRVLKKVTKLLQKNIRSNDTLARWGGDEFIIIMEGLKSPQDASILAQKILNVLSVPCEINSHELYVTSSIGISIYPKDSENADNLVKFADSAMYKAKDEGKNNYKYYSQDMTKMAFERVVMESSIRAAIKNNEFIVHYQPQVDAKNNKLIGMEALVRWNHPNIGLVSPYKFLPLAEETGLIVDIDMLVMDMAMKQFSKWKQDGFNPGVLSLNLAVKYLEEESYLDNLQQSMKKYSIDTRYLILELTESDIMKKPESSIKKLKEISALGINIAIDDFGTGYSSLSYLKRLPMDELKIDKSFIDYIIDNDDEGKSIVKAIIAMANTLSLVIVAEGVEEEIQKDFLLENGCNIIQGYYYSKPIPADEMLEFIKGMDND